MIVCFLSAHLPNSSMGAALATALQHWHQSSVVCLTSGQVVQQSKHLSPKKQSNLMMLWLSHSAA
jgi:hypothetical protein